MKLGSPESITAEDRARYVAQFTNAEDGAEALGLKMESKPQKRYWKEILKRVRWYR